jgi:hypothetical protein
MGTQRQQPATRALLVLVVVLGSLWVGGIAASAAADAADQLAAIHTQPGFEPAALPDRIPVLRPAAERPDPGGRLLPLLLGLLAAPVAVACGARATAPVRLRSGPVAGPLRPRQSPGPTQPPAGLIPAHARP